MKQDIKRNWVEALRSGVYQQGKDKLRTRDNEFCCLGVLCDLAVQAGVGAWETYNQYGDWEAVSTENPDSRSWSYLPEFVSRWAGLLTPNPHVEYNGEHKEAFTYSPVTLGGLNDQGETFAEIARIIEEQL